MQYSCISIDFIYSHKLILLYPSHSFNKFPTPSWKQTSGCDAQIGTFAPGHWTIGLDWCTTFWRLGWRETQKMMVVNDGSKFQRWVGWFLDPQIFVGGKFSGSHPFGCIKFPAKGHGAQRSVGSVRRIRLGGIGNWMNLLLIIPIGSMYGIAYI